MTQDGCQRTYSKRADRGKVGEPSRVVGFATASLLRSPEVPQIRWRLVPLGRHQLSVGAPKIVFILDADMRIGFRANLREPHRTGIWIAGGLLGLGVGPRQRMIELGDLVVKGVAVGLVEIDPLLDDGLIVAVEWDAGD